MRKKIKLVQALYGAVILTIMMQPIAILGYSAYIWMMFMPLLLFFAFGANFKIIPSMILSYGCGIGWALINGLFVGLLSGFINPIAANALAPVVIIFCILTVHENLLEDTVVGNVPALFMGLASTFFTFLVQPANAPTLTPIHLIAIFIYGVLMSVVLAGGGFALCRAIFGETETLKAFTPKEREAH